MRHMLLAAFIASLSLGMSAPAGAGDGQDALKDLAPDGPIGEFVLARAAAQVCRDRHLTTDEARSFLKSLSLRDPQYRSPDALEAGVARDLREFAVAVKMHGCDDPRVLGALTDWDHRVTLFARIPPRTAVPQTATGNGR